LAENQKNRNVTPPAIYLHRLGCPKIEADHDLLQAGFRARGARMVETLEHADTVVISTCAFIEDARKEAIDDILEAVRWKKQDHGRRIFVTGCMPLRYEDELRDEIPEVDGWYGFGKWKNALETIVPGEDINLNDPGITHPGQMNPGLENRLSRSRTDHPEPFAYVRIAEGCDRRCAYCAIPSMRGPYHSRPEQSILLEIEHLLESGVREIILVAQEINSYGYDLGTKRGIESLLYKAGELVSRSSGRRWLRILYTHPPLYSESFIEALAATPALVPYVDFPIEHADDSVLKAMGRGTTWNQMEHWISRLRESIPGITLRTSIIVGHPGEGSAEFDTLIERLERVRFERLGIFRYSREEGTRSAMLAASTSGEAQQRFELLTSLTETWAEEWYSGLVGMETSILVESSDGRRATGRTEWDAPGIDGTATAAAALEAGIIYPGIVVSSVPWEIELAIVQQVESRIG